MNDLKSAISLAEKEFNISLVEELEINHLRTDNFLLRWKSKDLELNTLDMPESRSFDIYFTEPILYLDKGAKAIPSKSKFEKEIHQDFLATYFLSGYGNGNARSIQTKDFSLFFFTSLESPLGKINPDSMAYDRDFVFSGAITIWRVDEGLVWGFWPSFNPYKKEATVLERFAAIRGNPKYYDNYIEKITSIVGCQAYTEKELELSKFRLIHEEPSCNWKEVYIP